MILVERAGVERYVLSMDVESETVGRVASRNVEPGSRFIQAASHPIPSSKP